MLYVPIPMLKLILFYPPTYLTNYLCTTLYEPHEPPLGLYKLATLMFGLVIVTKNIVVKSI
jgi:hypothetical protein